jgi:outer membrane immunogenic protein
LVSVPFGGLASNGGFGGGEIGYNLQAPLGLGAHWLLGVEADIQGSDIRASGLGITTPGSPFRNKFVSNLDFFGTVRGRMGYAFDSSLLYFTGGFAYGGVDNEVIFLANTPHPDPFKKSETATGYVLGGGYEYKLNPAWSLKAEYQYINLGKTIPVGVSPSPFVGQPVSNVKVDDDAYHTVRIGLNYHLLPGYSPLK